MRLLAGIVGCSTVLAACGGEAVDVVASGSEPAPAGPQVELDSSKVLALSADFAIHKGINEACEGDEPDHLSAFFADLQSMGAANELVESARVVATEMYDMARKEEPEYVCTPEMHEGVASRVSAAWLDWDDIRMGVE